MANWLVRCAGWLVATVVCCNQLATGRQAVAAWLTESHSVKPGSVVRTVVELDVQPGWHVYWINPGESGLPTAVEWDLPSGWRCGPLQHPRPVRFKTGALHGFGHEGRVHYPVSVIVPEGFKGSATLKGTLNWLACNEGACVPGSADLELVLAAGEPRPSAGAPMVARAHAAAPRPPPLQVRMEVTDAGSSWRLQITGRIAVDLVGAELFPATPEACDPSQRVVFALSEDRRVEALIRKGEYAADDPRFLEFWALRRGSDAPWILRWENRSAP